VYQYENAINLNPGQLDYYERLTEALFAIDKPREEDAKFLNMGLRQFPGADWVRVGTAVVDYRLGHHDAAMATLDSVLRPPEHTRGTGTHLRRQDAHQLGSSRR